MNLAIVVGRPVKSTADDKNIEPMMMKAIMHEVRTDSRTLSMKLARVKVPEMADSSKAPATPIAADSVGVATPV